MITPARRYCYCHGRDHDLAYIYMHHITHSKRLVACLERKQYECVSYTCVSSGDSIGCVGWYVGLSELSGLTNILLD